MTATALPAIADLTGSGVTEAGFKTQLTNLLAALREMGYPLGGYGQTRNLGLAFSVSGSALTCTVKQADGSTSVDSTNPATLVMRSGTLGSGNFNVRNIASPISLTISNGSTLGHANSVSSPIYWYALDNSGTIELAASTKFFGFQGLMSTTAEGGSGGADSATVAYSASARVSLPYLCLGRTMDTQATAGTWAAAPTECQLFPFSSRVMRLDASVTAAGSDIPISFEGDEDTGFFRKSANTIGVSCNGAEVGNFSSSGFSATDCVGGWVASQAEMEAATSPQRIVTPARQHYHPGMAKFWVYFDGNGGATINASYNVSGVVRNSAGDYTISFTNAFSSANYAVLATCGLNSGTGQNARIAAIATGNVQIQTTNAANSTAADAGFVCVMGFGDQ